MRLQFGELNITPRVVERLAELGFTANELQEAIDKHKGDCDGKPSVFVVSLKKYYEGSWCGLWINLTSFNDYDEYITFGKAIHSDESDPGIMAVYYKGFPSRWHNRGFISKEDFDNIIKYYELSELYGKDTVDGFMKIKNDIAGFENAYCGKWDSKEDFARHIINKCYNIEKMMGSLANYFNYEAYVDDLFMYDYRMDGNNNVFRRD